MKTGYLVTESADAATLLKKILPPDLLQAIEVVSAGQKYAALSLAGTIMSERSRPVLLVVDAESNDLAYVKEREQTLTGLLLPAASVAPYEVCLAVPSVGAIGQNLEHGLTAEELNALQQHPTIQRITRFFSNIFSPAV
jgi:hypothetical protein